MFHYAGSAGGQGERTKRLADYQTIRRLAQRGVNPIEQGIGGHDIRINAHRSGKVPVRLDLIGARGGACQIGVGYPQQPDAPMHSLHRRG